MYGKGLFGEKEQIDLKVGNVKAAKYLTVDPAGQWFVARFNGGTYPPQGVQEVTLELQGIPALMPTNTPLRILVLNELGPWPCALYAGLVILFVASYQSSGFLSRKMSSRVKASKLRQRTHHPILP